MTPFCHLTIGPEVPVRDLSGDYPHEDLYPPTPQRCRGSRCSAWRPRTFDGQGQCGLLPDTGRLWPDPERDS